VKGRDEIFLFVLSVRIIFDAVAALNAHGFVGSWWVQVSEEYRSPDLVTAEEAGCFEVTPRPRMGLVA
jgi:hypothetical protein